MKTSIRDIMERRMIAAAEHCGLMWINVFDAETNPFCEVGYFQRKDGVRSYDLCLYDLAFSDTEAKKVICRELTKLLGCECDGSGI